LVSSSKTKSYQFSSVQVRRSVRVFTHALVTDSKLCIVYMLVLTRRKVFRNGTR